MKTLSLLLFFVVLSFNTTFAAGPVEIPVEELRVELDKLVHPASEDPGNTVKVHDEDLAKVEFKRVQMFPLILTEQGFKIGGPGQQKSPITILVYLNQQPVGVFYATLEEGKIKGESFGFEPLAQKIGAVIKQFPDNKIVFFTFTGRPMYGFMMGGKGAEKPTLTLFTSVKDWNHIQPLSYNEGLEELSKWEEYKGGGREAEPKQNE